MGYGNGRDGGWRERWGNGALINIAAGGIESDEVTSVDEFKSC